MDDVPKSKGYRSVDFKDTSKDLVKDDEPEERIKNIPGKFKVMDNGKLCEDPWIPINTEEECISAAKFLDLVYGNSWVGPRDFPDCLFANDGRGHIYFNKSPNASDIAVNKLYAGVCKYQKLQHRQQPKQQQQKQLQQAPQPQQKQGRRRRLKGGPGQLKFDKLNCGHENDGAKQIRVLTNISHSRCTTQCRQDDYCEGILRKRSDPHYMGICYLKKKVKLTKCKCDPRYDFYGVFPITRRDSKWTFFVGKMCYTNNGAEQLSPWPMSEWLTLQACKTACLLRSDCKAIMMEIDNCGKCYLIKNLVVAQCKTNTIQTNLYALMYTVNPVTPTDFAAERRKGCICLASTRDGKGKGMCEVIDDTQKVWCFVTRSKCTDQVYNPKNGLVKSHIACKLSVCKCNGRVDYASYDECQATDDSGQAWCYVEPDICKDQSTTATYQMKSYLACHQVCPTKGITAGYTPGRHCMCGLKECSADQRCIDGDCLSGCPDEEFIMTGHECLCNYKLCDENYKCIDGRCLIGCLPEDYSKEQFCLCTSGNKCKIDFACNGTMCLPACQDNIVIVVYPCECSGASCYPDSKCINLQCYEVCDKAGAWNIYACLCNKIICNPRSKCIDKECLHDCSDIDYRRGGRNCLCVVSPSGSKCTAEQRCFDVMCLPGCKNRVLIGDTPCECNGDACRNARCTDNECFEVCKEALTISAISCDCGGVNCSQGNTCISDRCLTGCTDEQIITQRECYCNGMKCAIGHKCLNGHCLIACRSDQAVNVQACFCNNIRCLKCHQCIQGECMRVCKDVDLILNNPCLCTPGNNCKTGERCVDVACLTACTHEEVISGIPCDCSGQRCTPTSICKNKRCTQGCTHNDYIIGMACICNGKNCEADKKNKCINGNCITGCVGADNIVTEDYMKNGTKVTVICLCGEKVCHVGNHCFGTDCMGGITPSTVATVITEKPTTPGNPQKPGDIEAAKGKSTSRGTKIGQSEMGSAFLKIYLSIYILYNLFWVNFAQF